MHGAVLTLVDMIRSQRTVCPPKDTESSLHEKNEFSQRRIRNSKS